MGHHHQARNRHPQRHRRSTRRKCMLLTDKHPHPSLPGGAFLCVKRGVTNAKDFLKNVMKQPKKYRKMWWEASKHTEKCDETPKKVPKNVMTSSLASSSVGRTSDLTNLKNMRKYYKTYPDPKGQTLSAQLSWSHNCLIMRASEAYVTYSKRTVTSHS